MSAAVAVCSRLLGPLYTSTKTTLLGAVTANSFRLIHTSTLCAAGQNFRVRRGLARSGNEYGPLTDLPDWSYLDGTLAPPSTRRLKREAKRRAISARVHRLMKQVDEAQLKEVYDELGMPYEVKTKDHEAERTPEKEGVKGASDEQNPESSSNSYSDETGAASRSKTD